MPPEDGTIAIVHNGEYFRIADTAIGAVNAWTALTPLEHNNDDISKRIEELEIQLRDIQSRLDSMCIDAEELGILKEQVSLLELLKSDTQNG